MRSSLKRSLLFSKRNILAAQRQKNRSLNVPMTLLLFAPSWTSGAKFGSEPRSSR